MNKRSGADKQGQTLLSPGLEDAPVLDLMCSHFVLTLAARQDSAHARAIGFGARRAGEFGKTYRRANLRRGQSKCH